MAPIQNETIESVVTIKDETSTILRLLADLNTYESFHRVVSEYGITRPVVELMLAYDMDPKLLGIEINNETKLPMCEYFGIVNSAQTPESIACLEGIDEHISTTRKWLGTKIAALCRSLDELCAQLDKVNSVRDSWHGYQTSLLNSTKSPAVAGDKMYKAYPMKTVDDLMTQFKKCNPNAILAQLNTSSFVLGNLTQNHNKLKQFSTNAAIFSKGVNDGQKEIRVSDGDAWDLLEYAKILIDHNDKAANIIKSITKHDKALSKTITTPTRDSDEEKTKYEHTKSWIAFRALCVAQLAPFYASTAKLSRLLTSQAGSALRRGYEHSMKF